MQRVGDRARAVVAGRLERAVAAAPDVRARCDFITGGDHARDDARAFAGRAARRFAVGEAAVHERRGRRLQRRRALDAEQRPRRRADDAVDVQPVARLQPLDGGLGLGAERAVGFEVQRRLQPRDFVAARRFAAFGRFRVGDRRRRMMMMRSDAGCRGECGGRRRQRFGAADADDVPRRRADDTVGGQPVAGLKTTYGGLRFRPEVAVDGKMKRGLQARDGVAGGFAFF